MFRQYRKRFAIAIAMVLASNCLLVLNPLLLRKAISSLNPSQAQAFSLILAPVFGEKFSIVSTWALALLSISAVSAYFKYLMRIQFISISRDVERSVRLKLFERIQSQSRAFYDRHGIGELMSRLTNDISAYRDVIGPGIMYPIYFLTLVFPGMLALFYISPELAMVSLIPLAVIPILNETVKNQIYLLSFAVQEYLGKMSNMVQEHYSGIRIIKGYNVEHPLAKRFADLCHRLMQISFKLATFQGLFFPLYTLITKIVSALLVFSAGYIIFNAWNHLTAADFVSFMWIQSYIFFPILMLSWVLPIYQRGRAAYARLLEIYEEPIEVMEGPHLALKIEPKSDISFNNLTFSYPGANSEALSSVNLTIHGGTFVGITGPVGAGKSTLFRLLNREYEIPADMISIGGHDIHDYDLEAFSQSMITVEQIPFIFSKTIADNVRFGRGEATIEEIEMVSRHADLHEAILEFPDRYETLVGERGVTLSGGQKQRVAMARAFLVDRSILLLDDIFSAIDTATEHRIFQTMRKNFPNKTVLLISHRISILDRMDRVIYLKDGRVAEDGTPDELLEKKGFYAALHELHMLFE